MFRDPGRIGGDDDGPMYGGPAPRAGPDYDGYPLVKPDGQIVDPDPQEVPILVFICDYCNNYNVVLFEEDKSVKCAGCSSPPPEGAELIMPSAPAFKPALSIQGSYQQDTDEDSVPEWSPGTVPPKERYLDEAELMKRAEIAISDGNNEELVHLLARLRQFQTMGDTP